MSLLNERHVDTARAGDNQGGGNFPTLMDFLNRKKVVLTPWNEQDFNVNGQTQLLDSSIFPGVLAIGGHSTDSTVGGYVVAILGGALAASTEALMDDYGNIANLVEVRDSVTHDFILDASGRKVYGLLQCPDTAADGDPVGDAGSENMQVSFVIIDEDSNLQLVAVNGVVEFSLPKVYAERHTPRFFKEGGSIEADIIQPSSAPLEPLVRKYVVTSLYATNEVIDITTGAGSNTGAATVSGDTITSIGASSTEFEDDNRTRIRVNGDQLTKGLDVFWDSETSLHFSVALDPEDTFEIEVAE